MNQLYFSSNIIMSQRYKFKIFSVTFNVSQFGVENVFDSKLKSGTIIGGTMFH